MLSPDANNALIDLTTAVTGYENAWRASVHAAPRDSETRRDASEAMSINHLAAEDASARLGSLIGADTAKAIRAALTGATCAVQAANPREGRDADPTIIAKIVRRPHDYF